MSTKQHTKHNHFTRYFKLACLSLAAMIFVSAQATQSQANDTMYERLCQLVDLASDSKTRDYASDQFAMLSQYAESDANLPYLHALTLAGKYKYSAAVIPAKLATDRNSQNPNAWKLRIWLTITVDRNFDDGMETMERLAERLNADGALVCGSHELLELSDFMGRVYGYLAGPGNVDSISLNRLHTKVATYLTPTQNEYFSTAADMVMDEYLDRMHHIDGARSQAQQLEEQIRSRKLGYMSEERNYLRDEMEKVEDNRMEGRRTAANERNHIAAYRGSGYGSYGESGHYLRGRRVIRLSSHYYRNNYGWERGLDDRHYADVNRREANFNEYLSDREQNLRRRMNRLAKDEERMLRRPNTGNSREVRSSTNAALALRTYAPFPLNASSEINNTLAMYK